MLQVSQIREQYDQSIEALAKRGVDAREVFDRVLKLDEQRRATQAQLDETLAQSNTFSKEIGQLFQNGQPQKANILKEKTTKSFGRSQTYPMQSSLLAVVIKTMKWYFRRAIFLPYTKGLYPTGNWPKSMT
jgi:seryl-tRNA synthetase